MPTDQPCPLAQPLRACADGLLPNQAGVELLIDHGRFLHRADFRQRFVDVFTNDGLELAEINWAKAITAMDRQEFACSGSEARVLRLAASIADGIPVDLREALTGLDTANLNRLTTAILNCQRAPPATRLQHRTTMITLSSEKTKIEPVAGPVARGRPAPGQLHPAGGHCGDPGGDQVPQEAHRLANQ